MIPIIITACICIPIGWILRALLTRAQSETVTASVDGGYTGESIKKYSGYRPFSGQCPHCIPISEACKECNRTKVGPLDPTEGSE